MATLDMYERLMEGEFASEISAGDTDDTAQAVLVVRRSVASLNQRTTTPHRSDILEVNSTLITRDSGVQRKNLVMVLRLRTQALDAGTRGPSVNDMRGLLRVFEDVMRGTRDVPMEYMAYDLTDAEEYAEGFAKGISIMAIGDHGEICSLFLTSHHVLYLAS